MRNGAITELVLVDDSLEGVAFLLPPGTPDVPRAGEILHLLLESQGAPLPATVRAEVLDVLTEGSQVVLICSIRAADTRAREGPEKLDELSNRREAFRVAPKGGTKIPVVLIAEKTRLEGWLVDVSTEGMRVATSSQDVRALNPGDEVRLEVSFPKLESPVLADSRVVRTLHNLRPYLCAVRFDLPAHQSEVERLIARFVMERQREIIQVHRGGSHQGSAGKDPTGGS